MAAQGPLQLIAPVRLSVRIGHQASIDAQSTNLILDDGDLGRFPDVSFFLRARLGDLRIHNG